MVCCKSRGMGTCTGTWFKEHDSLVLGAKTVEDMSMSNLVAERDAVLCMIIAGARAVVDDICAKPDSSGSASQ